MHAPATGRYRHFKGGYYQVLALALHTETGELLVVYQSEQDGQVYARPVARHEKRRPGRLLQWGWSYRPRLARA